MAAYYVGAVRGSEPRTCPVVSLWNRPQDGTSQPEGVVNASFPLLGSALEPRGFRRWQRASVALLPPLLRVGVRVDGVGQNPWHTTIASKPKAETSCICSFPHRRASPRAIVWGGGALVRGTWEPRRLRYVLRRRIRHGPRRLRHEPRRLRHAPRGSGVGSGMCPNGGAPLSPLR
jgi:hypothetical protein